ncbi:MAG: hypothetical protein ACKVOU_00825 [Cytophagales bacterium]
MARIAISKNAENLLALANKVYEQHQKLGASSPLSMLEWNVVGPIIQTTLEDHNKAEELRRLSEISYARRDKQLVIIDNMVKSSRDVLKGIYRNEPKKLGEYGFEVSDTTKVVKIASK